MLPQIRTWRWRSCWKEAVEELEKDELVLDVLGRGLAEKIIKAHKKEYHDYCLQVTDWELSNYLYKL